MRALGRFGNFLAWRALTYAAEIEIGILTSPGPAQYLLRIFICIRSETMPWFLNIDMVARAWKVVIVLTSSTIKAFAASMPFPMSPFPAASKMGRVVISSANSNSVRPLSRPAIRRSG